MKTKIRIQESEFQNGYKHMHIQILESRYGRDSENCLETIGEITFQKTQFPKEKDSSDWYGMNYHINTDNPKYIDKMAKIAKFIHDNRTDWNAKPDEIKKIIGAEEHVLFDGEFIPVIKNGFNSYRVIVEGNYYSNIVAPTEMLALKELKKRNIAGGELKFHKVISF